MHMHRRMCMHMHARACLLVEREERRLVGVEDRALDGAGEPDGVHCIGARLGARSVATA